MKTELETLNPTRVRLTVEVPFEELKPSVDSAYKKIAGQVVIPGFRKGKVPPRIIDQRFGRSMVLEEAVNEALPKFFGRAVEEKDVQVLGHPHVDVTDFVDGERLTFTAEVDVRPDFELPDYRGLSVTVDSAAVTDDDIAEQLDALRDRFAVLSGVDRAAADGDYVSIDLAATVDGESVDELNAKGLSYQVGQGSLLQGLDQAVAGLGPGQSRAFTTDLAGGDYAGRHAQVTVTVRSVKDRQLPELDDDFAQTASEFDTLDELRDDLRSRLERIKRVQQGVQARDRALDALLREVDLPVPEGVIKAEVEARLEALQEQLDQAGLPREEFFASENQTEDEFVGELEQRARHALAAQFVLDKIVAREQLSIEESELTEHIVRTAARYGMAPEQFAQQVVQSGQVPTLVNEVVRGKALALVLGAAQVVDEDGRPVDVEALRGDAPPPDTTPAD